MEEYTPGDTMRRAMIEKRKKQQRMKGICTIFALIAGIMIVFGISGVSTSAHSIYDKPEYKYFKSYELQYGDSLWSIAVEHMDEHHYASANEYMEEVCLINSISPDDKLISGTNLIIPYYSQEFRP